MVIDNYFPLPFLKHSGVGAELWCALLNTCVLYGKHLSQDPARPRLLSYVCFMFMTFCGSKSRLASFVSIIQGKDKMKMKKSYEMKNDESLRQEFPWEGTATASSLLSSHTDVASLISPFRRDNEWSTSPVTAGLRAPWFRLSLAESRAEGGFDNFELSMCFLPSPQLLLEF